MNREVLFRGKNIVTGEWVYGYFAILSDFLDEDEKISIIIPEDATLFPHGEISLYEIVKHETVGQWTGFLDKNGKKIFEGDVIGGDEEMSNTTYCVNTGQRTENRWTNKDVRYLAEMSGSSLVLIGRHRHDFSIIGNIHDNPELLGGKK